MNKFFKLFVLFIVNIIFSFGYTQGKDLRFSSNHWPPWIIIEEKKNQVKITGIDIEIIQELASRLHLTLKSNTCPWKRCLEQMKYGKTDILNSV